MATKTQINGLNQILANSVPWSVMSSGAIVPIASIVSGSSIILSTGSVAMAANLSMGGFVIQNHAAPVNATDVVNKIYVDTKVSGFEIFGAAAVSVTNIATLSGLPTVDSYTMLAGQVVLLTNQTTTPAQKGPWVVAAGAWTRPAWWSTGSVVPPGAYFLVDPYGTTYSNTKWWMTTIGTITVDTTAVSFAQDSSGTTYTVGAGGGLTLAGSAFSVNTGNGITLSGGNVTAVGTGIVSVVAGGISITNSSSAGQIVLGNASNVPTWTTISGDATLGNTGIATLATVNSNVGSFGSSTAIPTFTVNGKGLITAAATAAVVAPAGTLSGTALNASVVSSSLTSVGTLGTLSVTGTTLHSGVVTMSVPPILTGLTGFVYANGASAVTVSTTIPSAALVLSANEIPTGLLNGANTSYTLAHSPAISSLELAMNGIALRPGASYDYTITGSTITMNYAPISTDYLSAYYFY
jgi:hypothetical protein